MKKIGALMIIIVCISASCNKENIGNQNDLSSIQFKTVVDVEQYAQDELDTLAKAMVGLLENQAFISILHEKVNEMFDGDYNVLFTDLIEACDEVNLDLVDLMKNYYHSIGGDSSLIDPIEVFQNINGYNYYPQIYVPNIDDNNWDSEVLPIVCSYNGRTTDSIDGYSKDEWGNIYQVIDIEEDDALDNQIWIISINEDVNEYGVTDEEPSPDGSSIILGGDEPSLDGDGATIDAAIEKIKIMERRESWPGGKSEIAIRLFATYTSSNSGNPKDGLGMDNVRGQKIYKIKKSDITNQNWINEAVTIATEWESDDYDTKRVHIGFVLFERDWCSGTKWSPDISIEGDDYNLEYRSRDDAFAALTFTSMEGHLAQYVDQWQDGNASIELKLKKVN